MNRIITIFRCLFATIFARLDFRRPWYFLSLTVWKTNDSRSIGSQRRQGDWLTERLTKWQRDWQEDGGVLRGLTVRRQSHSETGGRESKADGWKSGTLWSIWSQDIRGVLSSRYTRRGQKRTLALQISRLKHYLLLSFRKYYSKVMFFSAHFTAKISIWENSKLIRKQTTTRILRNFQLTVTAATLLLNHK